MSLWEYKVITSGKGGFATPALLEKFLNDLGRDEWEIIHYQTPPDNFLAFTGLARRSTQRDWTLQDAAAAAAKAEAEKLRAEFEAKFKAASSPAAPAAEERMPSFLEEKSAPDDGLRKLVDTSRDDDPEAQEDDKADEWDKLAAAEEDELPTFFEAMRPHMRRNQRGPGMSVGVDYLAKKWDLSDEDVKGALVECGFVVPADEDSPVEYVEYDGDLFWLNINRRGELWINTKEKPRQVFRPVKASRIEVEAPKTENNAPKADAVIAPAGEASPTAEASEPKPEAAAAGPEAPRSPMNTLPEGTALLEKIRPHMRRNRRGPGGSGSMNFLSRALRTKEADLKAAIVALGFTPPASPGDKPVYTEIGDELWWLNLDSRGGLWINGREKKDGAAPTAPSNEGTAVPAPTEETPAAEATGDTSSPAAVPPTASSEAPAATAPASAEVATEVAPPAPAEATSAPTEAAAVAPPSPEPVAEVPVVAVAPEQASVAEAAAPSDSPAPSSPLAAVRGLLRETKTGAVAGKIERLADDLGQSIDALLATLVATGLKVPEKPREKPVFVEHEGEILWFNRNAKGEVWLNAKAAKFVDKDIVPDEVESEAAVEPVSSGDATDGNATAEGDDDEADKKSGRRGTRTRTKKAE